MPPIITILGPTATGKSRLAMALARHFDGEIVNADALQAYRGFDIGTAKPSAADRREIPHHLVDILPPDERYTAGGFARRARSAIADIRSRGRVPLVVGGSGLYLRALLSGISPMPEIAPPLRTWVESRQGLEDLRRMLRLLDPPTAARLAPGDSQRTRRAVEIALSSGRPQSWWIDREPFGETPLEAVRIGLTLPRAILYDRIAARVSRMLASGWVEEVESLLTAGLEPDVVPAFRAIGYRELARHLRGEWSRSRAEDEIVRATRRFAKRQLTWFEREPDVEWLDATDTAALCPLTLDVLSSYGL